MRALPLLACLAAACARITGSSDANLASRLSLRANNWPELTGSERNVVADDSVIIRAIVVGEASAYGVPVVSAADPSALELRGDGTARVRHPAQLVLTAFATASSRATRPDKLVAGATLNLMCTMELRSGVTLTLHDSATGRTPAGRGGMRLRTTSGTYTDSLIAPTMLVAWGTAWERRGTYTLTVDADGYLPWRRDGVDVAGGLCHVITTPVLARLQRK